MASTQGYFTNELVNQHNARGAQPQTQIINTGGVGGNNRGRFDSFASDFAGEEEKKGAAE